MRWSLVLLLATACTPAKKSAVPPTTTADPPHEELDVPRPEPAAKRGVGPLVPYLAPSSWAGKGIPPKQYSLFELPEGSPLLGWAALDRDACEAELGKRNIAFTRGEDTAGVRAPIRLNGPLHGVAIHSRLPAAQRSKFKADLIDCRLAIALDEFATTLAARDIDEVILLSGYRSKNEGGCTVKYPGEQHCAALAVDVASFGKKDGRKLVVEKDFHGKIGNLTCETGTPAPNELWEIACGAAGRQFQVILTPNWNAEHHNHFHLELSVHEWVLIR